MCKGWLMDPTGRMAERSYKKKRQMTTTLRVGPRSCDKNYQVCMAITREGQFVLTEEHIPSGMRVSRKWEFPTRAQALENFRELTSREYSWSPGRSNKHELA